MKLNRTQTIRQLEIYLARCRKQAETARYLTAEKNKAKARAYEVALRMLREMQ